jgi:hypothetical protein
MNKLIALIFAAVVLITSCAHQQNLSEEKQAEYRRAKQVYDRGQKGGP